MPTRPLAVVLLSGGLDSAVALAMTRLDGFECLALLVDYRQQNASRELHCARTHAIRFCARDLRVDLRSLCIAQSGGLAVSPHYVPGRNGVLLASALAVAEQHGAERVVIGATAEDRDGFPDCRPDYFEAWSRVASLGMARPPSIVAPLVDKSKSDVVRLAVELGVSLANTWSCYTYGPKPCGACGACVVRARGFAEAGIIDPLTERE